MLKYILAHGNSKTYYKISSIKIENNICELKVEGIITADSFSVDIPFSVKPNTQKILDENKETDTITTTLESTYDGVNVGLTQNVTSNIKFVAPLELQTRVTIRDDAQDAEVQNPDILNINKDTTKVTIKPKFYNSLDNISNLILVGRIPYETNKFVVSGSSMESEFSTTMKPNSLQAVTTGYDGKYTIYYSTNNENLI